MLELYEDSDSRKLWVAPRLDDSDWPVYIFVSLEYTENWGDNAEKEIGEYYMSISAVSVGACDNKMILSCRESLSLDDNRWQMMDEVSRHVALLDYGTRAILYQSSGNDDEKLVAQAKSELGAIRMLFGCYMDKMQNAIGATGWDTIAGRHWPEREAVR